MYRIAIGTIDKDGKWEFDHMPDEREMYRIRVNEHGRVQVLKQFDGSFPLDPKVQIWPDTERYSETSWGWDDAQETHHVDYGEHDALVNDTTDEFDYYENDIVLLQDEEGYDKHYGVLEMYDGRLHINWGTDGDQYCPVTDYFPQVIGNIYQHPYLLSGLKGLNVGWYDPETNKIIPGEFSA